MANGPEAETGNNTLITVLKTAFEKCGDTLRHYEGVIQRRRQSNWFKPVEETDLESRGTGLKTEFRSFCTDSVEPTEMETAYKRHKASHIVITSVECKGALSILSNAQIFWAQKASGQPLFFHFSLTWARHFCLGPT